MSKEKFLINNPKSNNSEVKSNNAEVMRNKQIKEMAKVIDAMEGGNAYIECFDNAFADADKIAEVLYNAGYRKQEWISVDERLPDEDVRVLVWLREPSAILRFVQFDTDRIVDGRWVRWNNHITHWMPLPEPPMMKGGAE